MTDVELCISLVPEAGEHYRRALDVVSAYPDYAKNQFRIVVEHLTYMLARRFRVEVDQVALFEAINELYLSREQIKHHRQIQPALIGADVGDVRYPNLVGFGDIESALQMIR